MVVAPFLLAMAVVAAVAAVFVVLTADVLHAALALIVVLLALAGIYAGLGAPFIAAVQVIVYAGAIVTLFVFAVMILESRRERAPLLSTWKRHRAAAGLAAGALLAGLWGFTGLGALAFGPPTPGAGALPGLAHLLFGEFLLPFELVGVLLLVAVVAVLVLARRDGEPGA